MITKNEIEFVTKKNVKSYLNNFSDKTRNNPPSYKFHPNSHKIGVYTPGGITNKLEIGDLVQKGRLGEFTEAYYEIDDIDICSKLGYRDSTIPSGPIYRKFESRSVSEIEKMFGKYGKLLEGKQPWSRVFLPISKAYEKGIGTCCEMSILAQLSAQRKTDAFLINGSLEIGGKIPKYEGHTFNIIFGNDNPWLLDITNPIYLSNGQIQTYMVPIEGLIIGEEMNKVIIQKKYRHARIYFLS